MNENNCVIFAYTRKQAIADRVLVDVTKLALERNIRIPTAFTSDAYDKASFVHGDDYLAERDVAIDDCLAVLLEAILKRTEKDSGTLLFAIPWRDEEGQLTRLPLKAVVGPDDDGKPCLTVMLPHED